MDVSIFLNGIIILTGACFAQILLIEDTPSQKVNAFLLKHTNWKNDTYQKFDDVILPLIGAMFVLLFLAPQNVLAQAGAGLTWSTTVVAIANKFKEKYGGNS